MGILWRGGGMVGWESGVCDCWGGRWCGGRVWSLLVYIRRSGATQLDGCDIDGVGSMSGMIQCSERGLFDIEYPSRTYGMLVCRGSEAKSVHMTDTDIRGRCVEGKKTEDSIERRTGGHCVEPISVACCLVASNNQHCIYILCVFCYC